MQFNQANEVPDNAENLGILAEQCQLMAQQSELSFEERANLVHLAAAYRRQEAIESSNLHPCHTEGCTTMVAGCDYCPRCEAQINGGPYPFANILAEPTRAFKVTVYALLACSLILLAFVLAVIL